MKAKAFTVILCLAILAGGCKKEEIVLPDTLVKAKADLTTEFENLNELMDLAATYMASVDLDSTLVRAKLQEMVNSSSFVAEFSYITPGGIMKIIEPSIYYGTQGSDISQQSHISKAFQTRQPVLSQQFLAIEGFYATVFIYPIVKNGSLLGGITALFFPQLILENVLKPLFEGKEFEIWVMQKGGSLIYSKDDYEIGRNLYTDSLYFDFPDLIAAGRKIDAGESGKTTYSFYSSAMNNTVTKLTYWDTFTWYGTEWKLIWVKPE